MRNLLKSILIAATATLLAACGGGGSSTPAPGNLAEVATTAGYSTLVEAAQKAGLVPALSDPASSLTLFAPTNAAFTALATSLGFADSAAMLAAVDGPTLAKVLSYHVLPESKDAAALAAGGPTQATLYNFPGVTPTILAIDTTAGVKLTDAALNTASVTSADLAASNGVMHGIDRVLVPPGVLSVLQMAQTNLQLSFLVEAVAAAGLTGDMADATTLTVFAPTNDAFASALTEFGVTKEEALADPGLANVLLYHAVAADLLADDLVALAKPAAITTLEGGTISVGADLAITDSRGRVATLVGTDMIASNGVIHMIDKVLLLPLP